MTGILRVVATPIGNLDDLTPRAARALAEAEIIACEDTRVTRKLLARAPSNAKLVSYRSANEKAVASELAARIASGANVALVTDAGTPGVSDPGHPLIEACLGAGVKVEIVPGPSAAVAALVVSGLPTARFVFEGFLPHTRSARIERLRTLLNEERTIVLFEAPHRIVVTLKDMIEVLGATRRVAMAREMTKIHEQIVRTTLEGLRKVLEEAKPRGEITLVVEGAVASEAQIDDEELASMVAARVAEGSTRKDAIASVASETGVARNRVYKAALR
ncbi:MAG: 16S rRNA (cytidine(1402)-2'-O)-methyltransferase [Actinomycetota bacterium]